MDMTTTNILLFTIGYLALCLGVYAAGAKGTDWSAGKTGFGLAFPFLGLVSSLTARLTDDTAGGLLAFLAVTTACALGRGIVAGAYANRMGRRWTFALWGMIPLAWVVMLFARPADGQAADRVEPPLTLSRR